MLYNERISDERNARRKERAPAGRRRKDFRRRYESATDTETRSVEVERGAKKKQSATLEEREPLQAGGERISEGVMRVQRTPKHGVLRWSEERKKQSATPGGKK